LQLFFNALLWVQLPVLIHSCLSVAFNSSLWVTHL
jgi:hypothetical protein